MTNQPVFYIRHSETVRDEFRCRFRFIAKSDFQATSATKPTNFMRSNQGIFGYVTTAAEDDVAKLQLMLRQSLHVSLVNSSNSVFYNAAIANIGRHDNWNSEFLVVRRMKLAPKWPRLDCTALRFANFTESGGFPLRTHTPSPQTSPESAHPAPRLWPFARPAVR